MDHKMLLDIQGVPKKAQCSKRLFGNRRILGTSWKRKEAILRHPVHEILTRMMSGYCLNLLPHGAT